MSATTHRRKPGAIARAHLKDPGGTGCIWRRGAKKHNADCCNHMKNSYAACKGRAPYQSSEYHQRWQAEGTDTAVYDRKADQKEARAAAIAAAPAGHASAMVEWAKNFDRSAWLDRKLAMYGDAFHRLSVKRDEAWKVGATVSLTPAESGRYFGRKSAAAAQPNHAVPGLGAWYPYDHNHHHIVPVGSIAKIVYAKKTPGSAATTADRVDVMVQSKWNINGKGNVTILPLDVNVAMIVRLPAHCPWGGKHIPYLRAVDGRLEDVKDMIENACEEVDKAKKHEVRAAAAAWVKQRLDRVSRALYRRITTGNGGGRALGSV